MSNGMKYISSDKDTQFDSTLAVNAIENESIDMPSDWVTAGIYKCVISELMLQCTQGDLDLELVFYRDGNYNTSDMSTTKIIDRISMATASAGVEQIGGANQYFYKNPMGQSVEYVDEDHSSKIHVGLVNRDGGSEKKNTAASGTILITTATNGSFTSVTVGGTELLSAPVAFSVNKATTAAALDTEIQSHTGVSGWTSSVTSETVTITASSDAALGEVSNGLEIVVVATGDIATTDTDPSGALGDVVLSMGCTPYFS